MNFYDWLVIGILASFLALVVILDRSL